MKILHTADLHFSNKPEKLAETITVTNYILKQAANLEPDVSVLAGDTVDEHDGPIRLDSDAARAAIRFVSALADICPVLIVRGTRSHDREAPYIFRALRSKFPIHVATEIEQVELHQHVGGAEFVEPGTISIAPAAVFTCIPSPDKANLIAQFGGESRKVTSMLAREAIGDVLAAFGAANAVTNRPTVLVAHGMITGAAYGGVTATGEDFEFSVSDIQAAHCDVSCFGHVHKMQSFPGNIHYSGSPGRLNFGEAEEKGFFLHEIGEVKASTFHKTPARRLLTIEDAWERIEIAVAEAIMDGVDNATVRVRYSIPDEERHKVDREAFEAKLLQAGARSVKIEMTIIPVTRQRAAGISQMSSLPEKVRRWGEANAIEIPAATLEIAEVIEGREHAELIEMTRGGKV